MICPNQFAHLKTRICPLWRQSPPNIIATFFSLFTLPYMDLTSLYRKITLGEQKVLFLDFGAMATLAPKKFQRYFKGLAIPIFDDL